MSQRCKCHFIILWCFGVIEEKPREGGGGGGGIYIVLRVEISMNSKQLSMIRYSEIKFHDTVLVILLINNSYNYCV